MMNTEMIMTRMMSYMVEGLVVAFVAHFIPNTKLRGKDLFILGVTAGATFMILDFFSPGMADAARVGTGLSVGTNLAGGIRTR
jgi:hypothetical protein